MAFIKGIGVGLFAGHRTYLERTTTTYKALWAILIIATCIGLNAEYRFASEPTSIFFYNLAYFALFSLVTHNIIDMFFIKGWMNQFADVKSDNKHKIAYVLWAILGTLGIHRFYLKNKDRLLIPLLVIIFGYASYEILQYEPSGKPKDRGPDLIWQTTFFFSGCGLLATFILDGLKMHTWTDDLKKRYCR